MQAYIKSLIQFGLTGTKITDVPEPSQSICGWTILSLLVRIVSVSVLSDNNNNNNNNVWQCLWCCHHGIVIARVHRFIWRMQTERWTKPTDLLQLSKDTLWLTYRISCLHHRAMRYSTLTVNLLIGSCCICMALQSHLLTIITML